MFFPHFFTGNKKNPHDFDKRQSQLHHDVKKRRETASEHAAHGKEEKEGGRMSRLKDKKRRLLSRERDKIAHCPAPARGKLLIIMYYSTVKLTFWGFFFHPNRHVI